jgi:hypothetical protein
MFNGSGTANYFNTLNPLGGFYGFFVFSFKKDLFVL